VRPTTAAKYLHSESLVVGEQQKLTNQVALDTVLKDMLNRNKRAILIHTLDNDAFPCGNIYFEKGMVVYPDDVAKCKDCVIVHNNWIVGKDAKIYRFKEIGMWQVDSGESVATVADNSAAGGYYSNPQRRYLSYENNDDFGSGETLERETNALKSALYIGHLLNRTVILPSFHCYGCVFGLSAHDNCRKINKCFDQSDSNCRGNRDTDTSTNRCALNAFYKIDKFNAQFSGAYREHVFLEHPKVPDEVKRNQSRLIIIESPTTRISNLATKLTDAKLFTPSNLTMGASSVEIQSWFTGYRDVPVLKFHSLYDAISDGMFSDLVDDSQDKSILKRIQDGFKSSTYRQY